MLVRGVKAVLSRSTDSPASRAHLSLTLTLTLTQGTAVVVGSACMLMLLPMLPRFWVTEAELH